MIDLAACARLLRAHLLHASGLMWWAKRQLRRRGAVVVLTFHRVLKDSEFRNTYSLPGMVVRHKTFARLAAHVSRRYEAVDFARAAAGTCGGKLRVLFTFDDGWADNGTNAVPIARNHGIPVTIFICPGLLGRTLPFWPEQVAALKNMPPSSDEPKLESLIENLKTYVPERRQQVLREFQGQSNGAPGRNANNDRTASWEDVRAMDAAGISFGCHTQTHQILTNIPLEVARQEIREAKRAIEASLYRRCDLFAYPNGDYSPAIQEILSEEGFAAAVTTDWGAWTRDTDSLAIPRINISESNVTSPWGHFSQELFECNVFWRAWRAMKTARQAPVRSRSESALSRA